MRDLYTIYKVLLVGNYIAKRHGNKHSYAVYKSPGNPICHVSESVSNNIGHFMKVDKKGRMTLNLSTIRQLHGNHDLKKLYKIHRQKK